MPRTGARRRGSAAGRAKQHRGTAAAATAQKAVSADERAAAERAAAERATDRGADPETRDAEMNHRCDAQLPAHRQSRECGRALSGPSCAGCRAIALRVGAGHGALDASLPCTRLRRILDGGPTHAARHEQCAAVCCSSPRIHMCKLPCARMEYPATLMAGTMPSTCTGHCSTPATGPCASNAQPMWASSKHARGVTRSPRSRTTPPTVPRSDLTC